MSKTFAFIFAALLVLALHIRNSTSSDVEEKRRDSSQPYSPLWFGPRIGRKKRNPGEDMWTMDRDEFEVLFDHIKKNPWSIIMFSNGRSRVLGYNPKYNKEGSDEMNDEAIGELVQRSAFAPRLGRSAFFPRLGRENEPQLQ